LKVLGIFSIVSAVFGAVSLIIAVEGFWNTVGMIFIGAPIVLMLSSWPLALGQAMNAIADIGDEVGH
jgi:hypothetical protein|nr:hypothetical protein [Ilumatobacteraceae bacterium]